MDRLKQTAAASTVLAILLICGVPAWAAEDVFDIQFDQLEQIIVTAQKREQNIEEVPISVIAISGEEIVQRAIVNLQDLSSYIPGVTINEAVIDNNLFIRGIGSGVNSGFERSVGTYIDGLYVGRAELSRLPFLDLQRVEVLKGPQGTLFGKNTIAGAVNLTTIAPTDRTERSLSMYVDPQHADIRTDAILSGTVAPNLSARIAARYHTTDGYYEHINTADDVAPRNNLVLRGQLRWQPSSALAITGKLERTDLTERGRAKTFVFAGPGSDFGALVSKDKTVGGFRPGAREKHDLVNNLASVNIDYDFNGYRFTSITGYLDYSSDQLLDALSTPYFLTPGDDALFVVDSLEDYDQLSQEFRFLSPRERAWTYLLGFYAQQNKLNIKRRLVWPVGGVTRRTSQQEGESLALFAQLGWQPSEPWQLSLGARLNSERKDFQRKQRSTPDVPAGLAEPMQNFALDRDTQNVTGALQIQYSPAPSVMAYFSFSTGFKDGGFDESQGLAPLPGTSLEALYEFDEETVRSVEVGSKFSLIDKSLAINVALFRSEYDDLQTSVFNGVAGFFVANAASSVTQGMELDARWRVNPRLKVTASLAYLDTFYAEFMDGPCSQWHRANTTTCMGPSRDLTDESLPFAPEYSANFNVDYRWPLPNGLSISALLDVLYTDTFFTASDLDPLTRQDSYARYDLRLALSAQDDRWEIALIGKNLSDEFVASWRNDATFSGSPGRQNTYTGLLDAPRTVAIQAKVQF